MSAAVPGPRLTRDNVRHHFRPVLALLDEVIAAARAGSTLEKTAAANPDVSRTAHLHRLAGTKRWMRVADGLVENSERLPKGYGVESSEEQHNGGQYVFRFPGGVFTVKREAHRSDEEGAYLQEAFDGLELQSDSGTPTANAKVFLSVGKSGPAKLIVEHPTLAEALTIALDELRRSPEEIAGTPRQGNRPARLVRSSLNPKEGQGRSRPGHRPLS